MAVKDLGNEAKTKLIDLVEEVDLHLKEYWKDEIRRDFGFNESQKKLVRKMLLHGSEHNLRISKRLRASFVYYGYLLGKHEVNKEVWKAIESVELIHTALLMHDDFMDQDVVRRGGPTTQMYFANGDTHYGESMAVCLGDSILCLGFERLLECGLEKEKVFKAMKQLLRGITNTAFGQAYDASLPKMGEMAEEKVMALHQAKTAIYTYENPLFVGAILAGINDDVLQVLHDYSVSGGIAFQLQDDILGVFGDEEKTGKSINSDLLQGKVTLLTAKLMELGNTDQKDDLLKVWGKLKADIKDIERTKKAIVESGAYEYSVNMARKYAEEAAQIATKLRDRKLNEEAIDYIEGIARYMVVREV